MLGEGTEHERRAALLDRPRRLGDAVEQKRVVALVRVRIERHDAEEHDERLAEPIGGIDRRVERRIVERALRTLHPVDDDTPSRVDRPIIPPCRPRIVEELHAKAVSDNAGDRA